MAIDTEVFELNNASYTQLTAGKATVLLQVRSQRARIYAGTAPPASDTAAYYLLEADKQMLFKGLDADENIYARSDGQVPPTPQFIHRIAVVAK